MCYTGCVGLRLQRGPQNLTVFVGQRIHYLSISWPANGAQRYGLCKTILGCVLPIYNYFGTLEHKRQHSKARKHENMLNPGARLIPADAANTTAAHGPWPAGQAVFNILRVGSEQEVVKISHVGTRSVSFDPHREYPRYTGASYMSYWCP